VPEPVASGPAAAIELSAESVRGVWDRAVESVGGILAGNASMAKRVDAAGGDRLVASFTEHYTSCREYCERADQRARLEAALATVAGRPIQLSFAVEVETEAAEGPQPEPVRRSRREIRREVGTRPFVQRAAELFGADTEQLRFMPPEN
jgi:hypothetical protein